MVWFFLTCVTTMGTTMRAKMTMPIRMMQHIFYMIPEMYLSATLMLLLFFVKDSSCLLDVILCLE